MKLLKSKRPLYLTIVIIALCALLAALLWSIIARMAHKEPKPVALPDAYPQTGVFETRSFLLMEAMDAVGCCSPEDAAYTWAKGLRMRSAAMQYAVMTRDLKGSYAAQLQNTAPNWVTGMSSPWIDAYEIIEVRDPREKYCTIEIRFATASSTGPDAEYEAQLAMELEGRFWRIAGIEMDDGLYPYTGFEHST